MTTIFCDYDLCAAHFLPHVPIGHKCRKMHGHNYKVRLFLSGPLVAGMVCDFAEVDRSWAQVHKLLDHGIINERIENPTAESIAEWIFLRLNLPLLKRVEVWETSTCGAMYEPDVVSASVVHLPVVS